MYNLEKIGESAIGKDPIIKKVQIGQVRLDGLLDSVPTISIGKSQMRVQESFVTELARFLNINKGLDKIFGDDHKKERLALIRAIKTMIDRTGGGKEIYLIGDRQTKSLTGLMNTRHYNRMPNQTIITLADQVLNDNPDLTIHSHSMVGGNLSLNFLSNKVTDFHQFGKDESFRFGFTLSNTSTHSMIEDFNFRLVCKNGMMANVKEIKNQFSHLTGLFKNHHSTVGLATVKNTIDQINERAENGFIPTWFEERIEAAKNTPMSLSDLEAVRDVVAKAIDEPDEDRLPLWQDQLDQNHFYGIYEARERISRKKGREFFDDLTPQLRGYVKTKMSVWDAVNELTSLGSDVKRSVVPLRDSYQDAFKNCGGSLFSKKEYSLEKKADLLEVLSL